MVSESQCRSMYGKNKQFAFNRFMEDGEAVVILDARKQGVIVPVGLKDDWQLKLVWGYNLAKPTTDAKAGTFKLTGTLSFNEEPFFVEIPWDAVWAIVNMDGTGLVWAVDRPPESKMIVEEGQKTAKDTGVTRGLICLKGGKA